MSQPGIMDVVSKICASSNPYVWLSIMNKHEKSDRKGCERMRTQKAARNGMGKMPAMPVVARSLHAVVSERGYGEAGLLKLNKTKSFAQNGILLTAASLWPPRQML